MRRILAVMLLSFSSIFASCSFGQVPDAVVDPDIQTPSPATSQESIMALLLAEGKAVVDQDLDALAEIWAEDGVITDANHTPEDPSDDAIWRGKDAILNRYTEVVFPGNPGLAEPDEVVVEIEGESASARATTRIGTELSAAGDHWIFRRDDGQWVIQALTYNLETP